MKTNGTLLLPRDNSLEADQVKVLDDQSCHKANIFSTEKTERNFSPPQKPDFFIWQVEDGANHNFCQLGRRLKSENNFLYRNGSHGRGLIQILTDGTWLLITKAAQLAPVLVDSLPMRVMKNGKVVSELPTASHLNAMLRSEVFLKQFTSIDQVSKMPIYNENFSIIQPGYHDGGDGKKIFYTGARPMIGNSIDTINQFLGIMDFATSADRTNTVAAALTVLLRNHWPGQKPLVLITATKSHAGKGTTTDYIRGSVAKADVLYENVDWPMQSQFQRLVNHNPEIGVLLLDNVRLDSAGGKARTIRSAWIESLVTTADITLASPDAGEPIHLINRFVVVINTNDGSLSPDLLNRALPIHLAPKGDLHNRISPIGDPKLEFLPQNRERIEKELRWMIQVWKDAGCPLDKTVRHPMSLWAHTIGGILKANGFEDFLANYQMCRVTEDLTREALAILAGAKPGRDLKPREWANLSVKQGVAKFLFNSYERDTEVGRQRAIGVILSKHLEETFETTTETKRLRVRLEGGIRRWCKGKSPEKRYVFRVLEEKPLPVEE